MICFPNAKINLGLNIVEKRNDGFHNIETIFYPVGWNDVLEIIPNKTNNSQAQDFNLHLSGVPILGSINENLLYKAYQIIKKIKNVPSINVYLHKTIPMGAGLGGGSSDAAYFIKQLNEQFSLNLSEPEMIEIASQLGSDCAFFIKNKPVYATEKGNVFSETTINLSNLYVVIIFPNVHSNTKEAYSLVTPQKPQKDILKIINQPINTWKNELKNDFEESIFKLYPIVEQVKNNLYNIGAVYASMSGSGSAVFGLFNTEVNIGELSQYKHWVGILK
jgi:4-diphosphocytidyl-2-C-methyl-D-erythritol kinase